MDNVVDFPALVLPSVTPYDLIEENYAPVGAKEYEDTVLGYVQRQISHRGNDSFLWAYNRGAECLFKIFDRDGHIGRYDMIGWIRFLSS